ncbi:PREDICTED: octapeptide-repeat protein T2-like, partial [Ipomoea nil]|uniref:octapeptide-repeat protein T2-like n=1 Tax=Ipomoea nil TaxID=35883 RepID=UPI000900AA0B
MAQKGPAEAEKQQPPSPGRQREGETRTGAERRRAPNGVREEGKQPGKGGRRGAAGRKPRRAPRTRKDEGPDWPGKQDAEPEGQRKRTESLEGEPRRRETERRRAGSTRRAAKEQRRRHDP